jgi:hypothetical protein
VDDWSRWDSKFKRVHKILISPYDPDKRVWVDDDGKCAIFIFSNDGKQLLQTIGEPGVCGDDDKHFNRQTDIAWLPDGTFFVSDGYENTRVVKFDKNGKYLTSWGKPSWDWRTRQLCLACRIRLRPTISTMSMGFKPMPYRIAFSFLTGKTTASRFSTRTASFWTSGRWASTPQSITSC